MVHNSSTDPNSMLHSTTKLHFSQYVKHLAKLLNTSSSLSNSREMSLKRVLKQPVCQEKKQTKTCLACGQPKMVPLSTIFLISKALSGTSTVPQRFLMLTVIKD